MVFSIFALVLIARRADHEHQTVPYPTPTDRFEDRFRAAASTNDNVFVQGDVKSRGLIREMNDLYGAQFYPSLSRHGYLDDVSPPAAVVYGDLWLINGRVINKTDSE